MKINIEYEVISQHVYYLTESLDKVHEGMYLQDKDVHYFLVRENDGNVYHVYYRDVFLDKENAKVELIKRKI